MRLKDIKRPLASLVSFFIILSMSSTLFLQSVSAAGTVTVSHASITLSNSNPGTAANETISWNPSNTTTAVATIDIQYATTATGTTVPSGLAMSATPTVTITGFGSATATGAYNSSTGVLTVTLSTATAASSTVSVTVDSVTNPSAGTFYVQVTSNSSAPAVIDYGVMATTTVAQVVVTGTMDPSLSFTVTGVASGTTTAITGGQNTTTITTTSTTLPFGHFNVASTNVAAQVISTTTNAAYGYTVTLQENQLLTDASSSTIPNVTAGTWTTNTTTGFGVNVTSGDANTALFTANSIYEPIPVSPATPVTLATKSSATSSSGDSEYVNFQLGVTAAQPAGTYTNNLDYVVTPTY